MSRTARLGVFIVATMAILIAGILIVGNKKYLFSETYRLKAQFDNVVGLNVGAEVRVGGVHRGTVDRIDLPHSPSEKITVVMDMESSTHDIIKKDSIASIQTEGLLGNEYMSVTFGSMGVDNVRSGDTIASNPPLQMADLIKKTDAILDTSQEAIKNVAQITANLSSVSGKIDRGQGTVGALINDKQVYGKLDQTVTGMKDTVAQAQAGVTNFQENMEALKHNFLLRGYFKSRGYQDSAALMKDEISGLPQGAPIKKFTFDASQIFDKQTTAKLKNQKALGPAGDYLSSNKFGLAVVVAYTGMEGDSTKAVTLTEGRAMVVRQYLVEKFGFDDTHVKTLGLGKQADTGGKPGWGNVEVVVYPVGTNIPPDKQAQTGNLPKAAPDRPARDPSAATSKTD